MRISAKFKTKIKDRACAFLLYSGLLHIYLDLIFNKRKYYPAVLVNYHSFTDSLNNKIETDSTVLHKITDFEKELRFMRRYFDIKSLDEIVSSLKTGVGFKKPTIGITV